MRYACSPFIKVHIFIKRPNTFSEMHPRLIVIHINEFIKFFKFYNYRMFHVNAEGNLI